MFKSSSGAKGDVCKVSTHMEFRTAVRKQKIDRKESCFGGKGVLTKEQFEKNCNRAEEMLSQSRW